MRGTASLRGVGLVAVPLMRGRWAVEAGSWGGDWSWPETKVISKHIVVVGELLVVRLEVGDILDGCSGGSAEGQRGSGNRKRTFAQNLPLGALQPSIDRQRVLQVVKQLRHLLPPLALG